MFNVFLDELSIGITCDKVVENTKIGCIEFWVRDEPMFRVYEDNPDYHVFAYYVTEEEVA